MGKNDEFIKNLSQRCKTRFGEVLVAFMEEYNLNSLKDADENQFKEYIDKLDQRYLLAAQRHNPNTNSTKPKVGLKECLIVEKDKREKEK